LFKKNLLAGTALIKNVFTAYATSTMSSPTQSCGMRVSGGLAAEKCISRSHTTETVSYAPTGLAFIWNMLLYYKGSGEEAVMMCNFSVYIEWIHTGL
jgi:hypothetical protein